jgi:integrase
VLWDTEIPRFGLRVRRAGSRIYVVRLRVDGRQRWYTIGPHGDPWTPDTARKEAERIIGQAANVQALRSTGQAPAGLLHPVESRQRQKAAPTLAVFAGRYVEDYARSHKAASSLAADLGLLGMRPAKDGAAKAPPPKRTILAELGQTRLDRLTRADVTRFHLSRKDTPTRANRMLSLLSHMMAMAERWGMRPDSTNPVRHVERFEETKRERFLSGEELGRLGAALAAAEKKGKLTPFGLAAVRLLVFTGARASEILGLTWAAVDMGAGALRLPRKGRLATLYLNPAAKTVLSKVRRLKGNPHVIAGGLKGKALTLSGLEQVWQELRKAAKLEDVRLHDLRHSFASVAMAGGASLAVIGALLGHTQAQTTARYAHLADDPMKAAAGAVGRRIASAMKAKPKRGNVARIGRRQ